jgi:alpha-glucosidase
MWWDRAVVYQIYPRSYADSNGDGIGDLAGITSKLDHLEWLGVDALWMSPTFPSPNADWGYDVADYLGVHPDFGTMADLEHLLEEAERRHIKVLLDLVPNHTSDAHPWFHDPEKRDWYMRRDGDAPPNNWLAAFGGPAWSRDDEGEWYLHNFAVGQPDLDWWNEDVRRAFDDIMRFWFERGVAGFRIDVAHALVKDPQLRDNPPARPNGSPHEKRIGQWPKYNFGLPEAVDIHRRWRRVAEGLDPERLLLGETYVLELDAWAKYLVPDGLQLSMNFALLHTPFVAEQLAAAVADSERLLRGHAAVWHASSHDDPRFATRWAKGNLDAAKAALLLLLSLRGSAILYQGDELALTDGEVPRDRITDIADPPRDPERTPLPWTRSGDEWQASWLPLTDTSRNVEDQRNDPASTLNYVRELIAWRRSLAGAPYRSLPSPRGVWAYARGDVTCAVNLSDTSARYDGRTLAPWEAIAV